MVRRSLCRAFDVEMLYIAQTLGMAIREVAVNWQEIDGEGVWSQGRCNVCNVCLGSKMIPVFSWLQMGRDLLFIRLRYTFRLWNIKTKIS